MSAVGARMTDHEFRLIREAINDSCGIWVQDSARLTLENRLARVLDALRISDYYDLYYRIKYGDGTELERAVEAVVNHETYFFREVAQLNAVVELVKDAEPASRAVRILSAGCSTGEEPYTIAMLLDNAGLLDGGTRVEIHGVDISTPALDKARIAEYTSGSFRGTEGQYLDWYFESKEGRLRLAESLRRRVSFSRQNLRDAGPLMELGMFDVILCRNVIIYFDAPNKLRVVGTLSEMLRDGGHLFMGHSESLHSITNALEMVQIREAIGYRKPMPPAGRDADR